MATCSKSNGKHKIAVVSSGLGHVTRGIETWAEDLGHALWKRGVDVTLFKGGGQSNAPIERRIPCIQRHSRLAKVLIKLTPPFGHHFGVGGAYPLEQLTFALSLIPVLGKSYDIVHLQDPEVADVLRIARKLKLIKAKEILAHGTEEPPEFLQQFEFLQQLAPYHLQEIEEQGFHGKHWCAIPNFVSIDKFRPQDPELSRERLGIPKDAFVVLSVVAIKRVHKRIHWLLQEFASFKQHCNEETLLVVAGARTDETEELLALGEKLLKNNVLFFQNLPREKVLELYAAADVFVMCSLKEMMPIALLEAIASGLPIIGNTYPVIEWMVGPGGDCIDMAKKGELAGILERYMLDKEYRQDKGAKAREWALQEFSTDSVVSKIMDMYESVLEAK